MTTKFIQTVFITLFLLVTQDQGIKTPEALGKHIFNVLKSYSPSNTNAYYDMFITKEDRLYLANNNKFISQKTKEAIINAKQEKIDASTQKDLIKILEQKEEHHINWNELEFISFKHTTNNDENIKTCQGVLKVKHNAIILRYNVIGILVRDNYKLLSLQCDYLP